MAVAKYNMISRARQNDTTRMSDSCLLDIILIAVTVPDVLKGEDGRRMGRVGVQMNVRVISC